MNNIHHSTKVEVYYSPWGKIIREDEDDILYELSNVNNYQGNCHYSDIWGFDDSYIEYYFGDESDDKYTNDVEERYYRYEWEMPEDIIKLRSKILVPFINKIFTNTPPKNITQIAYLFINFFSNKNQELDMNNYRYFGDLLLQIEAFIETMNGKLSYEIISYILLGGYFNYMEFVDKLKLITN